MEVTEVLVARIPVGNLRVPRAEFVSVWTTAERLAREAGEQRVLAWYPAGVTATCRWLAGAVVEDRFGRRPAESPVTWRSVRAFEELIEAEYLAAELLDVRRPYLLEQQPGWSEGIRATLRWAWRRQGPPPLTSSAEVASVVPAPQAAVDSGPRGRARPDPARPPHSGYAPRS